MFSFEQIVEKAPFEAWIHAHIGPATWLRFVHEIAAPIFLVTLAQLMKPGIAKNVSCVVGDFAYHLGLLIWFIDYSCMHRLKYQKDKLLENSMHDYLVWPNILDYLHQPSFTLGFICVCLPTFRQPLENEELKRILEACVMVSW